MKKDLKINSNDYPITVGVLGGMGPWTDSKFREYLLIEGEKKDLHPFDEIGHLRIMLYSDPKMPKKNDYLAGYGDNPLPYVVQSLNQLEKIPVTFIAMPCNTIHAKEYLSTIRQAIDVPILNIVKVTALHVSKKLFGGARKVGLLATPATIKTNLYHEAFREIKNDSEVLVPKEDGQQKIWEVIQGVKCGSHNDPKQKEAMKEVIINVMKDLVEKGARIIIAGCTEIPLVLNEEEFSRIVGDEFKNISYVDSMKALARATVSIARGENFYSDCLENCSKQKGVSLNKFPLKNEIKLLSQDSFEFSSLLRYSKYGDGVFCISFKENFTHLTSREQKEQYLVNLKDEVIGYLKEKGMNDIEASITKIDSKLFFHSRNQDLSKNLDSLLFKRGVDNLPSAQKEIVPML